MKTMIKFVPVLLFLISCNSLSKPKVQKTGIVNVLNGKGVSDTVRYTCENCPELLPDMNVFNTVITEASTTAKNSLKNPLSFKARNIDLTVLKEDSLYYLDGKKVDSCYGVYINYKSIGQNAYGTEGEVEGTQYIYLVNNVITDLSGKLKRPPLGLTSKGNVDRTLDLFDTDETGTITIQPMKNKGTVTLIVNTSISCVDEGSRLTITFENDEELKLKSWNDFNCKSTSYFDLSKSDLQKLAINKIRYIGFYDDTSVFCSVPENNNDYLMQFVKLISN